MDVGFKQKKKEKKKKENKRRRRQPDRSLDDAEDKGVSRDNEDEGSEALDVEKRIEELREDQRLRQQVFKEGLANHRPRKPLSKRKVEALSNTSQYGLHDPKKDGSTNQKLLTLLDGQFTGQSATTDKEQHEELMNKFIDEKLSQMKTRKKQKESGTQQTEHCQQLDEASAALQRAEDQLFELPEHLIPDVSSRVEGDNDGTDGGMLLGSAGIAEVELPSMYSEKTVAATRKALEKSRRGGPKLDAIGGMVNTALPANFSVDFNRHRTDYVAEMKSMNKDEQRGRGFHQGRKNQASDDRAVSRFRKFESRKLRR
uniref:Uncharacterized protein n=1 Tax=Peronospora matthiolae TaxID=2874970 RepID=A0AAV1UES0_9STRA